jgi:integrase|tara:strand:+ start:209 stop:1306 length:1098 start_codon:yes stop_codon:yes gene_type:complete
MAVKLRKRKYPKKGERFYLDIYINEQNRTSQFLDIWLYHADTKVERKNKQELANQIRNRVEQDNESKKYRDILPKFKKETNFLDYADVYCTKYKNKDIKKVTSAIKHFRTFLKTTNYKNVLPFNCFGEALAYDFIDYLKKDSGLTASTPGSYLEKLTRIIKSAMRERYMLNNPFEYLSKKGLNKDGIPKNVLNNQELEILFKTDCSNIGVRKAFIIACYTGMGEAELRELKWEQIDFINKKLSYTRNKTGNKATNHLHPMIERQLLGLDKSKKNVFNTELPSSTNGINKVLKTWVKNAGIHKKITFYCARHTFGTSVCRVSGNQKVVAQAMGHKSTRFTDRYTKLVEEEHIKAVESLPFISTEIA